MIDAFAIYGISRGTLQSALKNTKLTSQLAKKLTRTRIHTKVQVLDCDLRAQTDGLKATMEDAKNMIYQHDLGVKPLWTREELNK